MTTHVTIDARMLSTAGIGTYLSEMLPRLAARLIDCRLTILGDPSAIERVIPASPHLAVAELSAPIYSLREQVALMRAIPRDTSVFWTPHYNIPVLYRGPIAVTVHDVAHLVLPPTSILHRAYAQLMFRALARRARVVFCDSAFTAEELARYTGRRAGVQVIHLGVAPRWFEPADRAPLEGPYFLFVGSIKPHKNLPRLLEAFAHLPETVAHRLVIIGRREGMLTVDRSIEGAVSALGERVIFAGQVSQDVLERYVRGCDALVLPSLYEGFGLPPLEALACGRPVVVSRVASLPEVCGSEAEYVDPVDVDSIGAALYRVATRRPETAAVVERRRAWARRFDWDRCAMETSELLLRAAAGPAVRSPRDAGSKRATA